MRSNTPQITLIQNMNNKNRRMLSAQKILALNRLVVVMIKYNEKDSRRLKTRFLLKILLLTDIC